MLASLLLLTLSHKSLLFCPSTWLPEADLVRRQSSVKIIAQVGGHRFPFQTLSVLSSLELLLSADVTCSTC